MLETTLSIVCENVTCSVWGLLMIGKRRTSTKKLPCDLGFYEQTVMDRQNGQESVHPHQNDKGAKQPEQKGYAE